MIHLIHIPVRHLSDDDLIWVAKMAKSGYYKVTAKGIVERGLRDAVTFWRIAGEAKGLAILSIKETAKGKALVIEAVAGQDLIRARQELIAAFLRLARNAKCAVLSGLLTSLFLRRCASEMNCSFPAVLFELEVRDATG